MKKLLTTIAVCTALFTGCKTTDTNSFNPALAENVAKIAGSSTAIILLAVPSIATNPQVKTVIYSVTTVIEKVAPTNGQTYTEVATPVINTTVDKFVAEGKITAEQAVLIKEACNVLVSGVDIAFAKYPKAKLYSEYTNLVVKSFMKAFNTVFNGGVMIQNSIDTVNMVDEIRKANKKSLSKMVK